MDNGFSIKPGASALRRPYAPRDPLPVQRVSETELDPSKTVAPPDEERGRQRRGGGDEPARQDVHRGPDHAGSDVVVDPETQDRLFRERDVRAEGREHPDQAILRQRAYGHAPAGGARPHADIEA
jgi:hypothetical protein